MPNEMILFQPGAPPAHILANANAVSLNANAQQGVRLAFPVVSIEGRIWSVTHRGVETVIKASAGTDHSGRPLPEEPVRALEVVIVGISAAISKAWYAKAFQPGVKILMPDCFSTNGETPDPTSPNMQSELCSTCPKNQFESAISDDGTRGKGKACRDGRKIAVVPAGDIQNNALGGPMMLRLPVMSIPNLAKYCGQLSIAGIDVTQVVTAMSFNMDVRYPEVVFSALGFVPSAYDYESVCELVKSDIVHRMLDETPVTETGFVSPVEPKREHFQAGNGAIAPVKSLFERLMNEPDPDAWIELLDECGMSCTTMGELSDLRSMEVVKLAATKAPHAIRQKMQSIWDETIARLSPRDSGPTAPNGAWAGVETQHEANKPTRAPRRTKAEMEAARAAEQAKPQEDGIPEDRWEAERQAARDSAQQPVVAKEEPTLGLMEPTQTQAPVAHEAPAVPAASAPSGQGGHDNPAAGAVAFEAWLVDGEGNEIPDEDGVLEAFTDPVAFARAFKEAEANEFPGTLDLFRKANHDSLIAAQIASTEVARILAPKDTGEGAPKAVMGNGTGAPIDPAFVMPPAKATPAEFTSYMERLKVVLAMEATPDWINRVVTANEATYSAFPPARRLAAKVLVEAAQKAISPPPPKSAVQTMELLATGIILDMEGFGTIAEMDTYKAYSGTIRDWDRLKAGDAWLYESVVAAERMERGRIAAAAHGPEVAPPMEKLRTDLGAMMEKIAVCTAKDQVAALGGVQDNVMLSATLARHAPAEWRTMRRAVQAKMATFEVRT